MKIIYYYADGEWYPMINVYEKSHETWNFVDGRTYIHPTGVPLELDDETAEFILKAYANFDKAHDMMKELVEKDVERRRAEYDARRDEGQI